MLADISNLRGAEEALNEIEHRYRELIEKLPVAIYTCDAEGRIEMYNRAAVNLWGREPKIGEDMWCGSWRIYHPNGTLLALDSCPMAIALKEGRPVYNEEIIVERPDGIRLNVLPHPQPVKDLSGNVIGAINMLLDITERKKAEEVNAKLAAIVQSSDDAIISKTLDGIIVSWNGAAERIFGYTAEEMIGESITKIIPVERIDEEPQILQRLKSGERIDHFETERITKEGKILNVSLTISPVKNSKGDIIGISKIARDITEQKRLYEALRESEERFRMDLRKQVEEKTQDLKLANLRLKKSNQELERFAYVASHDLQEPLRKIQAFGDLIVERNGNELNNSGKDYLSRMIKAARRMQHLIEALLEFSRSATTQKNFEKRDLNLLIGEVKKELQETIDEKQAVVNVSSLPVIPVISFQFKQMVSNIMSNALKYTKSNVTPVINITSEVIKGKDINRNTAKGNMDYCKITIKDNGIGFNNEDAERIFELFQRLHGMHEYNGSGIGLAICKKIAENHDGFIVAEGEHNKGAAFHVYIPVA